MYLDSFNFLIDYIIKECPICVSKYLKRKIVPNFKIITDIGPHYRYLMDITYLKPEINLKKTTYKYIIDFLDHFTKFYWGFLIKDKTAETVLKYMKIYIQINKKPKIIQCDNAKEFSSSIIEEYINKENIIMIHSRPRHPQTNGSIERYHAEVHKYLYNYVKEKKEINNEILEEALDSYIEYHNKTIKSSTKFSPNDIRDVDDPGIIEIISNNIIKSMKYYIIQNDDKLEKDTKLLLWDNIILKFGKYIKKSNTIGNYVYPSLFEEYVNNNTIRIKVNVDVDGLCKKDELININTDCCVIIPLFCYEFFLNKISKSNNIEDCKKLSSNITCYNNDEIDDNLENNKELINKDNNDSLIDNNDKENLDGYIKKKSRKNKNK